MASRRSSNEFSRLTENDKQAGNSPDIRRSSPKEIILTKEAKEAAVADNIKNVISTGKNLLEEKNIKIYGFNGNENSGQNIRNLTKNELKLFENLVGRDEQMEYESDNKISDVSQVSSSVKNDASGKTNQVGKNKIFNELISTTQDSFEKKKILLIDLVLTRESIRASCEEREGVDYLTYYKRGENLVTGLSLHNGLEIDADRFTVACTKYASAKGLESPITKEEYHKACKRELTTSLPFVDREEIKKQAGYASILYEFIRQSEPTLKLEYWPQNRSGYGTIFSTQGGFLDDAAKKVEEALTKLTLK